jgi:hypothetical protein
MIVAHNLDSENVDKVLAQYFSNFLHAESDYIPGKSEAIFFSKTSLVETNGLKVYAGGGLSGWAVALTKGSEV